MVEAGVKRGEAKAMSEAVLKVLGEALSEGEELSIPPLGKLKINRQFEKNGDEILVVKLRRPSGMLEAVAAEADGAAQAEDVRVGKRGRKPGLRFRRKPSCGARSGALKARHGGRLAQR